MKPAVRARALAAYQKLDPVDRVYAELLLEPLNDKEDLRNWVRTFYKIELPSDITDDESNSNPLDAMWQIYEAVKFNKGDEITGFIMLSAREAYKTLSASMLEVLLLLHFQVSISHMAAILKQSDKAVSYINAFFVRLEPYITANGWKKESDSKTKIQFVTPEDYHPYIVIIVCTVAGANSEHTSLMFIDEIDVVSDPNAYEEAKFIPSMERGRLPLTVKLSTRKFAFGLMQKELDAIKDTGEILLRWNVIDITERCPKDRYKPDPEGKTTLVYAAKKLPLKYLKPEEYDQLQSQEKPEWTEIQAHPGCLSCKLLPVCRTRLASKPETSHGNLYRPIAATIKNFAKVTPDKGEAQLMCWRPSTKGLVYPRFDQQKNKVTIDAAYELVTGEKVTNCSMDEFVSMLKRLETKIVAGIDWGYTHEATIVIMAVCRAGYSFILETFGSPQLELSEFLQEGIRLNDRYGVDKWYCDTAAPANIKTWSKEFGSSKVPEFKKDVLAGIEAIRGQIIDAGGVRRLMVIDAVKGDNQETFNHKILEGFKVHHFILDAAGNPTSKPDDEEFADVMDALRYIGQNVFAPKGKGKVLISSDALQAVATASTQRSITHGEQLRQEIQKRAVEVVETTGEIKKTGKKIVWDF